MVSRLRRLTDVFAVDSDALRRTFVVSVVVFVSIWLSAMANTGSSPEFNLDLRGLGPWERRTAAATESLAYSAGWATNAAAGAKAVVKAMPVLKQKPKYVVIDLSGGTNATNYGLSYLNDVPEGGWSDEYKTSKLVLRHIPAGSFVMGGRNTDYPGAVNTNLHMVTITHDFYMGVFEVTQRQWELVMGNRPSSFTNETCYATRPVETISYRHIRGNENGLKWPESKDVDDYSFLGLLRRRVGLSGFDLPTEAQWEYACRAGTKTALNNGKDLTVQNVTDIGVECVNANEIARYSGNNPYRGISQATNSKSDVSTAKATAAVGSYKGNAYGLFDMSGNVWELCLNAEEAIASGSVDPVGGELSVYRQLRGGSWCSSLIDLTSGDHHLWNGHGYNQVDKTSTVGFRLCLQGGDVPDLASAATLVDEAGTGSQNWVPTRAGTYYLTHATMNAETNAQLLSAWFEVPGPMLTFTPLGELTDGVMVTIGGVEDGWTIRYTTDGSAPTADSLVYDGPFSLPASCTVRAVAYNEQGMASEEFSETFTLHDALGIVGAVARQRYPWNGKVDIDVELKGDPAKTYLVELTAKDFDGGTNLPMKTVSCAGASTICCVPPGRHRFTWDADADIQTDGEFPRVAVSVSATGSALVGYARQMALTVDGYTGAETLTDVPVLVRLSTAISGFDYSDFASPSNGADLAFFDANEQRLAYEIDEWHTNGESLVWVKLPELKRGARFMAAWGVGGEPIYGLGTEHGRGTGCELATGHEVWRDYAGVWHMNEDSGVAYDSTANGLDALPDWGTNKTVDVRTEMIGVPDGAVGFARQNEVSGVNATKGCGNYLLVPSYDGLALGGRFIVSGWFKAKSVVEFPRMISRKDKTSETGGWEMHTRKGDSEAMSMRGASIGSRIYAMPDFMKGWVNVTCIYDNDTFSCYTNGVVNAQVEFEASSDFVSAPIDNGKMLAIGCNPEGSENTWCGWYDEIRLRGGTLSADRIKADYDMIANRDFLRYGAVTKGEK